MIATPQQPLPDDPTAPKPTSPIKPPAAPNINQIASGGQTQQAPSTPSIGPAAQAPPMTPPAMPAPSMPAPNAPPQGAGMGLPPAPTPTPQTAVPALAAAAQGAATAPAPSYATGGLSSPLVNAGGEVSDKNAYLKAINTPGSQEAKNFAPPGYSQGADGAWLANSANPAFKWDEAANDFVRMDGAKDGPSSLQTNAPGSGMGSAPGTEGSGIPMPTPPGSASPALGSAAPGAPGSPAIGPAGGPAGQGVALSQVDPNADLRSQSILPTNGPDRFQMAKDQFDQYQKDELPQFQAKLRGAYQGNAALGRLGSGMLRTDVGNLDLAAQRDANSKRSGLLNAALEGTVGDQRNNRDEYRTERGYQTGQEQNAYDRGVQGVTLEDALTNSAFGRSLQQQIAGNANNPAQTQLLLSQIFGQQATGAGSALAQMIKGNAATGAVNGGASSGGNGNVADANQSMPQWLIDLMKGNAGTQSTQGGEQVPTGDEYGVAP